MNIFLKYKFLLENKQKIIRVAIIILLILAALFLFLFRTGSQDDKEMIKTSDSDSQTSLETDGSSEIIVVDVAGEVVNPSVIELQDGSRINDAIQAAGGLTNNADISQINRAAILSDGEKVYIPTKSSTSPMNPADPSGTENPDYIGDAGNTRININYASATQLQEIPGIGPVTADKIIQYRSEHGLFRKLEDIKKVSGIGDITFTKMKPYISI